MEFQSSMSLCLEIEGLLTLIQLREGKVPVDILHLLNTKVSDLQSQIATISVTPPNTMEAFQNEANTEAEIAQNAQIEEIADAAPGVDVDESQNVKTDSTVNDAMQPTDFSLNDTYRFKKELFNNSDEDFVDTIGALRLMSTAEEIKEYLYNDLCWDQNDPTVKDFVNIILAKK